jgi:DNA-binding transcriptional LysR family regulator
MRIDPRRLAILGAVADAGGVLAAAGVLHLTPSAVSQQISRLEAETGVILLDRSRLGGRRAAGLTPAGRMLATHAARLAETMAGAERDLATLTGQVTGPVTVGGVQTVVRHLLAPVAATIAGTIPTLRMRIRQIERRPGSAALQGGGLDLLLVETGPGEPVPSAPGLHAFRLLDDPYQIVYPSVWAPVAGVEALLTRPWVDGQAGSATRVVLDRIAAAHAVTLDRQHECVEFPAALALVAAGLAATVVPALALPADEPVEVLTAATTATRHIDLIHRRGRRGLTPAAELVVSALRSHADRLAAAGRG